jgi:hypothetical protein
LAIPETAGPLDDALVAFAAELVDRSQVAQRAEAALAKPTGRRRALPVRALLVGLLVCALEGRPLLLTAVTDVLYRRLSGTARDTLAVTGTAPTPKRFLARYRCVRYCFHALAGTVDPSGLPKNRCLSDKDLAEATTPISPEEAEAARGRLEELINALIEASLSVMTHDERARRPGPVGLDATPVPLFSRGPSKRNGRSASDPDGGWYVREGDHRDSQEPTGAKRTKVAWALEATIATMAPRPGAATTAPNLALGLALARPGHDPAGTAVRVLASMVARGHQPGPLGADRAYTAALPEHFHLPVRALGFTPVMDYRIDQLGIQANSGGALLVEGAWYCPAMPAPLVAATTDRRAGTIDHDTYQTRIAARRPYRLKRKQGPDPDGYERLACPATGHHPGLMCPLRAASLQPRDGRPKVTDPPTEPPKICAQSAITIAPDVGARHRQDLAFGSQDWARTYATLRNTIEGLNGYAKDTAHEALAAPGRRRVRGIAAQSIFCALLLMAANLRKLRAHRHKVTTGADQQATARARRRRVSLPDFRPG